MGAMAARAGSIVLLATVGGAGYHLGASTCGGASTLDRVLALAWQGLPLFVVWGLLVYLAALLVLDVAKRV
ncbi:MAG: hypothetical protein A2Y73_08910 [Chloroflexi bacterium RBG_13_56_8]|nr:MAG: hypothetical protein A2Y73_08910 [Chloroflexi bacterium RBG_13_56_8]